MKKAFWLSIVPPTPDQKARADKAGFELIEFAEWVFSHGFKSAGAILLFELWEGETRDVFVDPDWFAPATRLDLSELHGFPVQFHPII